MANTYTQSHIENQPEHHARRSFRDEYLRLLERFGVDYDPKYVFQTDEN